MAVALADLLPALDASLNDPGSDAPFFVIQTKETQWVNALANAFWWAWMRGFFAGHKVDVAGETIVPVDGDGDDLSRGMQQVVVLFAALKAIEAKLLALPTGKRNKAGPVETETQRSAQLLRFLYEQRRQELEDIKDELADGGDATGVAVIDRFLAWNCSPDFYYVN